MAQWGRLIGVAKRNGIQVFERFEGNKRILSSIRGSSLVKTIETEIEKYTDYGKYVSAKSNILKRTTQVYDGAGNRIRYISRDVEECAEKNYKKSFYLTWEKDYNDFQYDMSETIEKGEHSISTSIKDKNTGYDIWGIRYLNEPEYLPRIRMNVRATLESENGVKITPGEYNCHVGKDGKLGDPDPTDDIHVNRDGAQALFDEAINYFKILFKMG